MSHILTWDEEIVYSDLLIGVKVSRKRRYERKLVYLYSSNISGKGRPNNDLYEYAKRVSIKRMYPDFVSADKGYMKEVYDRCGTIISPMGELLLI